MKFDVNFGTCLWLLGPSLGSSRTWSRDADWSNGFILQSGLVEEETGDSWMDGGMRQRERGDL